MPMVDTHQSQYGCVPETTIADGGYASLDNIDKGASVEK
jgi:hypothetical protein